MTAEGKGSRRLPFLLFLTAHWEPALFAMPWERPGLHVKVQVASPACCALRAARVVLCCALPVCGDWPECQVLPNVHMHILRIAIPQHDAVYVGVYISRTHRVFMVS